MICLVYIWLVGACRGLEMRFVTLFLSLKIQKIDRQIIEKNKKNKKGEK